MLGAGYELRAIRAVPPGGEFWSLVGSREPSSVPTLLPKKSDEPGGKDSTSPRVLWPLASSLWSLGSLAPNENNCIYFKFYAFSLFWRTVANILSRPYLELTQDGWRFRS